MNILLVLQGLVGSLPGYTSYAGVFREVLVKSLIFIVNVALKTNPMAWEAIQLYSKYGYSGAVESPWKYSRNYQKQVTREFYPVGSEMFAKRKAPWVFNILNQS